MKARVYQTRAFAVSASENALAVEEAAVKGQWTPLPKTMKSRTEVSGLTPACLYYFRFRALTRAGRQDYSHAVTLIVH